LATATSTQAGSRHRDEAQPARGPRRCDLRCRRGLAELDDLVGRLGSALALWRGTPYQDLEDAADAVAERARLAELRLVGIEDRALARLELGEHATVAAELEALAQLHPLRERLWALWAMALARAGAG
jgi:hypothetical protein